MRLQFECHAAGALVTTLTDATKRTWNLDEWHTSDNPIDYLLSKCNPSGEETGG